MAKFNPAKWPTLQAYWDVEYGMCTPFKDVYDVKMQHFSESSGGYAVVACKNGDELELADLSFVSGEWDMLSDGMALIPLADWEKLKFVPECDTFVIPGNETFDKF
jgi:hypothetical protein